MPAPKPLELRRRAALAGRVISARTGRPLANVEVEIRSASKAFRRRVEGWALQTRVDERSARPDVTLTRADGHFHFLDLPRGRYTVRAALPALGSRYAAAQAHVHVPSARVAAAPATLELALEETAIQGRLTGSEGEPVRLAEVRVAGGSATRTDPQGRYLLRGVEKGERRVVATARGFRRAESTATVLRAGSAPTLDFSLTPADS